MVDFVGGSGDDAFAGTEQSDTADGNGGSDSLIGNGGNDILAGGDGADYLEGGSGDDILFSRNRDPGAFTFISYRAVSDDFGTEVDTLIGGAGDDYIVAGYGDYVDGGAQGSYGNRLYISFQGATSGVSADFRLLQSNGSITIGGGVITNIQNIGYLEGSQFDDFLVPIDTYYPTGGSVYGRGGNDHIIGGYYSGWSGSALYGGDGNDIVDGRQSQYGPAIYGDAGDDTLYSSGNSGSGTFGGDGNDTIYGSGTINGGAGNDTIYLQFTYYGGQTRGGTGDDIINAASSGSTNVFGDEGADTFNGADSNDSFEGGAGNDIINGADGSDIFDGGAGNDTINGGNHSIAGSNGYTGDVAVFSGSVASYQVTQDSGTGVVTVVDLRAGSPDGTDTLTGIEILKFSNATYSLAAVLSGQATGVLNFVGTANPDTYYGSEDANTAIGYGDADTFYGYGGNDVLQGNAGGDYLDGGAGDDTLYSRDQTTPFSAPYYGNSWTPPTLDTGSEVDTLIGGDGSDTLFAGYGDNVDGGANGSYGDSLYISFRGAPSGVTVNFTQPSVTVGGGTITGIENINWVEGSDFADDITLASGNGYGAFTPIFGLGGDDRLVAGYYTGYMDGGDGNDVVDGRNSQYLQTVIGGAGDDTLYTATNTFASALGGDGNDTIHAHAAINGGAGNDTIYIQVSYYASEVRGGTGDDSIFVSTNGHSAVFGDDGNDTLTGNTAADTLDGGAGDDTLIGGGAINILRGGAGNDRFEVGTSDSETLIEGGADLDTLAVSGAFTLGGASSGIEVVELNSGTLTLSSSQFANALSATTQLKGTGTIVVTAQPGFPVNASGFTLAPGAAVTFTVNGSLLNDTVTGVNGTTNILNGAGGNDTLQGGTGNDTLDGGAGVNSLFGGSGNDRLLVDASGAGSSFNGQAGIDTLAVSGTVSSFGAITAMEGIDLVGGASLTLTGAQLTSGFALNTAITGSGSLTINMTAGQLLAAKLWSVGAGVAVTINGTAGSDVMKLANAVQTVNGGDGQDQIKGGNLVDTINGGGGVDKIMGQGGADILTGGAGNDVFRYLAQGDSGLGINADRITDFTIGQDRLNFKDIDADAVTAGDQAFAFLGSAAFTAPGTGQIRFQDSGADLLVLVDVNGDGAADMEVILQGLAGQVLSGTDFVL